MRQYRTGTIDFNRVFNLETTQVQQQDQLAIAAGNIALNLISTYRALGGGWELRMQKEQVQSVVTTAITMRLEACRLSAPAPGPGSLPEPIPPPRPVS